MGMITLVGRRETPIDAGRISRRTSASKRKRPPSKRASQRRFNRSMLAPSWAKRPWLTDS
jgi:hypothetical protein